MCNICEQLVKSNQVSLFALEATVALCLTYYLCTVPFLLLGKAVKPLLARAEVRLILGPFDTADNLTPRTI